MEPVEDRWPDSRALRPTQSLEVTISNRSRSNWRRGEKAKNPGYEFDGWYQNYTMVTWPDGESKDYHILWESVDEDCTERNLMLTAEWKGKSYPVEYTLNGGTNAEGNPTSYVNGEGLTADDLQGSYKGRLGVRRMVYRPVFPKTSSRRYRTTMPLRSCCMHPGSMRLTIISRTTWTAV